ncbi:MAG: hypothetical protein JKY96_02245, partial [Phycisphaerales bacterium]|nr:hypothetical protein [Phycisphaerales bacterium]
MSAEPHDDPASERVVQRAGELGFAFVGIADASASVFAEQLREWIAAGKHGTMQWMSEHAAIREDPSLVLE